MSQEVILESGGLNLYAQAWGDPSNTCLLALHGWLDNSSSFEPLGELLSDYYVLAPDLIGHGYSSHLPNNILYSFENHVMTILSGLDQLGIKKMVVMGHSLGAGIAVALAAVLPERVTKLVLLDTLGPPAQPQQDYLELFQLSMQSRIRPSFEKQRLYKSLEEAIEIRCLVSSCSLKTASLISKRDLEFVTGGFVSRADRRLQFKSHLTIREDQCQTLIRSVNCPTILFKADSGILIDRDLHQREACFQDLQIINIQGLHHFHIDTPNDVVTSIQEFCSQ